MITISTRVRRFNELRDLSSARRRILLRWHASAQRSMKSPTSPLDEVVEIWCHPKVVAIGEAGLDYHYEHSPREAQEKSFRAHIAAARETGLPLVIHARDADADMAHILDEEPRRALSRRPALLLRRRELAVYGLSSAAMCPSPASSLSRKPTRCATLRGRFRPTASWWETDAPYLAPMPIAANVNEPAFVAHTAAARWRRAA